MLACVGFLAVHAATGKVRLRRSPWSLALDMPWVTLARAEQTRALCCLTGEMSGETSGDYLKHASSHSSKCSSWGKLGHQP